MAEDNNVASRTALQKVGDAVDAVMVWIASSLGTNACIVLFLLIAVVPLYYQLPTKIMEWQAWLSQTFIQLVALGLLAKVANIEGNKSNKLLVETHDTVMMEMQTLREDQITADSTRLDIHAEIMEAIQTLKEYQVSAADTRAVLQTDIAEIKQILVVCQDRC